MRVLFALFPLCLLAGCGMSSAAPPPTPTAVRPAMAQQMSWAHAPRMTINRNGHYTATVTTTDGTFIITLLPRVAPVTVNNFVFLARHGYYNNNQFFRILQDFMVQTGDPTNTGTGGPGYVFKDEKVTMKYTPGTVAMANRGKNTNGSQFFIVTGNQARSLPPSYTIFGKVTSGMNVIKKIAATPVTISPTGEPSLPLTTVTIKTVVIHQS